MMRINLFSVFKCNVYILTIRIYLTSSVPEKIGFSFYLNNLPVD